MKLNEEFELLVKRDVKDQEQDHGKVDMESAIETAKFFLTEIYIERIKDLEVAK